jgi:phosphatidylglycerol lysyltransferase
MPDEQTGSLEQDDDVQFPGGDTQPAEPPVTVSPIDKDTVWPIRIMAVASLLSGLAGASQVLLTRLSTAHPKLFTWLIPYATYHWSKQLTALFGLSLVYLSINILYRKRMAWVLALTVNIISCGLQALRIGWEHIPLLAHEKDLAESLPAYPILPGLVAIAILIVYRNKFTVQARMETIRHGVITCITLAVTVLSYGTLGFFLLDKRDFGINMELAEAFVRTLRELFFIGNSDLTAHTLYARGFMETLDLFGVAAFIFGAYSLFRPLQYKLETEPREHALAKQILDAHGRTSLDSYMLLPDKSYYFGKENSCVIAYRTALDVAIVLSDPVGEPQSIGPTTKEFVQYCHSNGWFVAFLQTTAKFLQIYEALNLNVLKIGEDGIVDIDTFCKTTINKKTFKSVIRKFDKEGYKLERCVPPHAQALLNDIQAVSDEWLSLPGRRERTFSLGMFDRAALQECNVFVLKNPEGKIIAFVNQVRSYRKGEVTIDMMRHRVEVPNGTMDYLFAKLIVALKEEGFAYFSLGLAALSGVGEEPDASPEEKAIHAIYERMNRFFSYKGLRAYKSKFDPTWVDRYLIYEHGIRGLLRTTLALQRVAED